MKNFTTEEIKDLYNIADKELHKDIAETNIKPNQNVFQYTLEENSVYIVKSNPIPTQDYPTTKVLIVLQKPTRENEHFKYYKLKKDDKFNSKLGYLSFLYQVLVSMYKPKKADKILKKVEKQLSVFDKLHLYNFFNIIFTVLKDYKKTLGIIERLNTFNDNYKELYFEDKVMAGILYQSDDTTDFSKEFELVKRFVIGDNGKDYKIALPFLSQCSIYETVQYKDYKLIIIKKEAFRNLLEIL
jgi:hypothetical protein